MNPLSFGFQFGKVSGLVNLQTPKRLRFIGPARNTMTEVQGSLEIWQAVSHQVAGVLLSLLRCLGRCLLSRYHCSPAPLQMSDMVAIWKALLACLLLTQVNTAV